VRVAVIRFPGSNCDQDALYGLRDNVGLASEYVWHEEDSLAGFDAAFLPGGFAYGDYLRCGAIASRSPVMAEVRRFAAEGRPVLGVCNGFQVLCEAGILPGALLPNEDRMFVCDAVWLRAVNRKSPWTQGADRILRIPVAHGEGRYFAEDATIARLFEEDRVAFLYCGPEGQSGDEFNPNGSVRHIAGILSEQGNVLGMMPHPERATRHILGSRDGLQVLSSLADASLWPSPRLAASTAGRAI